jgi:hypothetical protein
MDKQTQHIMAALLGCDDSEPTIVTHIERARQAQQRHQQLHAVQLEIEQPADEDDAA